MLQLSFWRHVLVPSPVVELSVPAILGPLSGSVAGPPVRTPGDGGVQVRIHVGPTVTFDLDQALSLTLPQRRKRAADIFAITKGVDSVDLLGMKDPVGLGIDIAGQQKASSLA